MAHHQSLLLLLVLGATWAEACFIVNCPPGGKRSARQQPSTQRQCSSCGPDGKGHCYGPWICCGSDIGCRVKSFKDITQCLMEDKYPIPCDNPGPSCGEGGNGRCALKGLCCSTDGCTIDSTCMAGNFESPMNLFMNSPALLR